MPCKREGSRATASLAKDRRIGYRTLVECGERGSVMVKMGDVWDSATDAVRGRAGTIAPIAVGALFLPNMIQAAITAYRGPGTAPTALSGIVAILLAVVTMWGGLAILAVLSDPNVSRADAVRRASARLPAAVGVAALLMVAFGALLLPVLIALVAGGLDPAALQAGTMPTISRGTGLFVTLYMLALAVALLAIGARLLLVNPVVLHERIGLRAIGRSLRLTRGLAWKLVGVLLLFVVVILIAGGAAQFVTGTIFGLILGTDDAAITSFLAATVAAAVTVIFSVLAYGFLARLYAALTAGDRAGTAPDTRAPT
jgi:hypothetical protein